MKKFRLLTALPVFNEERHLLPVLTEVRRFADDILVVDDGSSDRTAEILAGLDWVTTVRHPVNKGYGAALSTAFDYAVENGFDVLVTIDCDGQHQPKLIPELAEAIYADGDAPFDIVSGSRYLQVFPGDSTPPAARRHINADLTERLNRTLELNLTDAFCGFKAYRVDALRRLEITEPGYGMPLELWVQAAACKFRIVEFPVPLIYLDEKRSFGGSLDDARRRMAYYEEILTRATAAAVSMCCGDSDSDAD